MLTFVWLLKSYWRDLIMMKSINRAFLWFTTVFYIYLSFANHEFVDVSTWPCLLLLCILFETVLNFLTESKLCADSKKEISSLSIHYSSRKPREFYKNEK